MSWRAVFNNPIEPFAEVGTFEHPRWVPYKGGTIPVDPETRVVRKFELKRPYVIEYGSRLYVAVDHVGPGGGLRAHPAVVGGK